MSRQNTLNIYKFSFPFYFYHNNNNDNDNGTIQWVVLVKIKIIKSDKQIDAQDETAGGGAALPNIIPKMSPSPLLDPPLPLFVVPVLVPPPWNPGYATVSLLSLHVSDSYSNILYTACLFFRHKKQHFEKNTQETLNGSLPSKAWAMAESFLLFTHPFMDLLTKAIIKELREYQKNVVQWNLH